MDNQAIRKRMKEQRTQLRTAFIEEASACICERCRGELRGVDLAAIYLPIQGEVDLRSLISFDSTCFCVPRVKNETELEFVLLEEHMTWTTGAFAIQEPSKGTVVQPENIDVMLVPLVAFTKTCERIGHGKGYYDRYLKRTHAKTIGVAYEFQRCDALHTHAQDVVLDMVVSEETVYVHPSKL